MCRPLITKESVNLVDRHGKCAFYIAVRRGCSQVVKMLLDWGADTKDAVTEVEMDKDEQTLLHIAAGGVNECFELCSILIEQKAKIDAVDKDGNQPLHLACKQRHSETGNLLLSHGADVTALNKQHRRPLDLASDSILKSAKVDDGSHALHIAAKDGDIQTVQLLVGCGADVNALNELGQTPLHTAAGGETDCHELCSTLLEHNVKIDAVDNDGNQPLHLACSQGHTEVSRRLLSNGANASASNANGQTSLHFAAGGQKDCSELCFILLEHKAKVDAVDKDGNQPLHLACESGLPLTVKHLLDCNADVFATNTFHQTALHKAACCKYDWPEVCAMLVAKGASMNATDGNGATSLQVAFQKGNMKTVEVLVENGADRSVLNVRKNKNDCMFHVD